MAEDITTFRANNPGLFQKAVDKGVATERQRCEDGGKLCVAAGAPAEVLFAFIESGATAAELVPQLNAYAGQSDQTAAAFKQKVLAMGLGRRSSGGARANDDADVDALIARLSGSAPVPSGPNGFGAHGQKDLGDLFAESLPPPRAESATGAPARAERASQDLGDLFAESLPAAEPNRDLVDRFASDLASVASRGRAKGAAQ